MSQSVSVRPAVPADISVLNVLATTVWVDTYCSLGLNPGLADYVRSNFSLEMLAQTLSQDEVFVAEKEGWIVGYAVVERPANESAELKTLYILPNNQGHGIGKALLQACEAAVQCPLWLTCWEHNQNAHAFYRHLGFQETGDETIVIDDEPIRNLVFKK